MEAIKVERKKHLRRWECAILISLSLSLCLGIWAESRQRAISASLVRLHVLAVSDDAREQEIKLRMRDAVLEYITPKLDEGKGHNWRCVVFPPVCQSAAESEELKEALSAEDYSLITKAEGYELRFRAVELWGELKESIFLK